MRVKQADVLSLKINLQSFVTGVGKFPSIRRNDEWKGSENRLI